MVKVTCMLLFSARFSYFFISNFLSALLSFITSAPPTYFSSLLCPSVIFLVRSHSSCVSIKGGQRVCVCVRVCIGGVGGGTWNRRVSQHGSVSFINIRFSQRDALKANSETSLLALRTKSPAPPSLFTPLSPFTNRYLSESDCMGLFSFQKRWHIKMIERNIYWAFLRSLEVLLFMKKAFKEQINCIHSAFLLLFAVFVSLALSRAFMVLWCFATTSAINAPLPNNSARLFIKLPLRSSLAMIFCSFARSGQIKNSWGFHSDLPWYNHNYCEHVCLRVHACCHYRSPPHLALHMAYEDSFLWVMSWLSFN